MPHHRSTPTPPVTTSHHQSPDATACDPWPLDGIVVAEGNKQLADYPQCINTMVQSHIHRTWACVSTLNSESGLVQKKQPVSRSKNLAKLQHLIFKIAEVWTWDYVGLNRAPRGPPQSTHFVMRPSLGQWPPLGRPLGPPPGAGVSVSGRGDVRKKPAGT